MSPGEAHLINDRWTRIPEDDIYRRLALLGRGWFVGTVKTGEMDRYYLTNAAGYAYPYSLPLNVAERLAGGLNKGPNMSWFDDYNKKAIAFYKDHGMALNAAADYWASYGDHNLPKPTITPISELAIYPDGLKDGEWYIAIIGLFHLTGQQNNNNHHLFIDLIDLDGKRIYNHVPPLDLWWEWEGRGKDQLPAPVRIDKGLNEPGANIGMHWGLVLRGFHVNTLACDQFSGIHIRYGNDGEGNDQGHHSHYIVLQKREWKAEPEPEPPTPKPEPEPPPSSAIDGAISIMIPQHVWDHMPPDSKGRRTITLTFKGEHKGADE